MIFFKSIYWKFFLLFKKAFVPSLKNCSCVKKFGHQYATHWKVYSFVNVWCLEFATCLS